MTISNAIQPASITFNQTAPASRADSPFAPLTAYFKDRKFEIVSTVAYLIGIPINIFENIHEGPKKEVFDRLEENKSARIIRNLSIVRNAVERNFGAINKRMKTEFLTLLSMPELVPMDAVKQLNDDGVNCYKKTTRLCEQVIELNRLISDRINNCKELFPTWINWDYIKDLFIMPNGLTEAGTKKASDTFYEHKQLYPYQVYINWIPRDVGNLLSDDYKFTDVLYQQHNDYFEEKSKTNDASPLVKSSICSFINASSKVAMFVDCENSDPYKMCAALTNLNQDALKKISKIILFDDIRTTRAWDILGNYTDIPIEHMMIERLKTDKSLVDIKLVTRACQEHYSGGVDSMILVSSDSDYWGFISSLPTARFLVMIEHEKCSPAMKEALSSSNIFYCSLDDFYSANADSIRTSAILDDIYDQLGDFIFNLNDMLDSALTATRAVMTLSERKQFFDRYLRTMKLVLDGEGNVDFELKR